MSQVSTSDLLGVYNAHNKRIMADIQGEVAAYNDLIGVRMVSEQNGRFEMVNTKLSLPSANTNVTKKDADIEVVKSNLKTKIEALKQTFDETKSKLTSNASFEGDLGNFALILSLMYYIKLLVVMFIYTQQYQIFLAHGYSSKVCEQSSTSESQFKSRIAELEEQLALARQNASSKNASLQSARQNASTNITQKQQQIDTLSAELDRKNTEIEMLKRQVKNSSSSCDSTQSMYNALLEKVVAVANAFERLKDDADQKNILPVNVGSANVLNTYKNDENTSIQSIATNMKYFQVLIGNAAKLQTNNRQLQALLKDSLPILANFALNDLP